MALRFRFSPLHHFFRFCILALGIGFPLASYSPQTSSEQSVGPSSSTEVVALVNGNAITKTDVDRVIAAEPRDLEEQT